MSTPHSWLDPYWSTLKWASGTGIKSRQESEIERQRKRDSHHLYSSFRFLVLAKKADSSSFFPGNSIMISSIFAAALALPVLALASPAPSSGSTLPPCSNVNRPCSCPAGTQFKNVTSYGIIGAPASDVAAVMNHCRISFLCVLAPDDCQHNN